MARHWCHIFEHPSLVQPLANVSPIVLSHSWPRLGPMVEPMFESISPTLGHHWVVYHLLPALKSLHYSLSLTFVISSSNTLPRPLSSIDGGMLQFNRGTLGRNAWTTSGMKFRFSLTFFISRNNVAKMYQRIRLLLLCLCRIYTCITEEEYHPCCQRSLRDSLQSIHG